MDGTSGHESQALNPLGPPGDDSSPTPLDSSPTRARDLIRLARPHQWAKGAFVLVGPAYAIADGQGVAIAAVVSALLAFGFASSAGYVVNDLRDADADRVHPRKRRRPIASGRVGPELAKRFAGVLYGVAALCIVPIWLAQGPAAAGWFALSLGLYVVNVAVYSYALKHRVILDVMSLASGFVLRVLGGCAAAGIEPSTWLLNCTFFLAMFLSFAKRLGERRTMGANASAARGVQSDYTDEILRMVMVMTAVATLVTYASYVDARAGDYTSGFNLLWLTMLPATYALLRCIVLVDRGVYDDPTELASHDRPFQIASGLFAGITAGLILLFRS